MYNDTKEGIIIFIMMLITSYISIIFMPYLAIILGG